MPLNLTLRLSLARQASSAEEMEILLTLLISKRLTLSKSFTKNMKVQLGLYFKAMGIAKETFLGMMTNHSSWAVPESFAAQTEALDQLAVPVLLLLTKLPTYYVYIRNEVLYLCTGVLFNNLTTQYKEYVKKEAKNRPKVVSNIVMGTKVDTTQDQKDPLI